jgi:nicotinamide riboside kinase
VKKIAIIGGPCSGKTVLAQQLNIELKMKGFESRFVEEYPTDYTMVCGPPRGYLEQAIIMMGQIEKEKRYEKLNSDYLVCDYASFVALAYYQLMDGGAGSLENTREKYFHCQELIARVACEHLLTYNFLFLADPRDIVFKKDSVRFQNSKDEALKIHAALERWLIDHRATYHGISGTLEQRVKGVLKILGNPTK